MEGNGSINTRNWAYFEQPATALKNPVGLPLMSAMTDKPFSGGDRDAHVHHHHHQYIHQQIHPVVLASMNGGPYHHHRVGGISGSSISMDYMKDTWFNQGEKYLSVLPNDQEHHPQLNYGLSPEASLTHSVQLIQQHNLLKNENFSSQAEKDFEESERGGLGKKRGAVKAPKSPKAKRPKKAPKVLKEECPRAVHRARIPKRSAEVIINGISMDISGLPTPVCTCTGAPQQCYRWGAGGWQSACCTTSMSVYPLPMSAKRRSARIAGRKMSLGAFTKVLERLSTEGYNFSNPIDLRNHWAKHGTNKFVTIR